MSLSRNDFRRLVPIGRRLEAFGLIEMEGNPADGLNFIDHRPTPLLPFLSNVLFGV